MPLPCLECPGGERTGAEGIMGLLGGEVCEIKLRSSPRLLPGPGGPWRFSGEAGGVGRGRGTEASLPPWPF